MLSILLGLSIVYIYKRLVYKMYGIFLASILVQAIFWMPRGPLVGVFGKFIFAWVIVFLIVFAYDLLKRKKYESNIQ